MQFGIHAGPQDCTIDDLRRLWRLSDDHGFHWCSVWDHLYSISDLANPASPAFEGIATMAALAGATTRVRVGCLVFCVPYRNAGLLAKVHQPQGALQEKWLMGTNTSPTHKRASGSSLACASGLYLKCCYGNPRMLREVG